MKNWMKPYSMLEESLMLECFKTAHISKTSKQSIQNVSKHRDNLNEEWIGMKWTDDKIWTILKKTYFNYNA